MLNVLLVEDDRDLALSLIEHLKLEQITCDYAANGIEGTTLISKYSYDVLIFDINMPRLDGISLCEKIRSEGNDTPVLMLTARTTLENKIEGFNAGTDDYMIKPFEIEELIVRLYALAKRRSGQTSVLSVGSIQLNTEQRTGLLNNAPVKLTPTAFKLLEVLMRSSPNPVSHEELMRKVWGEDIVDSNKIRVHIYHLRKLLNSENAGELLKTEPGYGFYISNN